MTRIHSKWLSLPATAGLLAFAVAPIFAQAPAQPTGKIHGHITNPTGAPQTSGNISLSNDGGHTNKYTFPVNAQGDYSGEAVAGKYTLIFRQPETPPDKMVDSIENVTVVAGQDTLKPSNPPGVAGAVHVAPLNSAVAPPPTAAHRFVAEQDMEVRSTVAALAGAVHDDPLNLR